MTFYCKVWASCKTESMTRCLKLGQMKFTRAFYDFLYAFCSSHYNESNAKRTISKGGLRWKWQVVCEMTKLKKFFCEILLHEWHYMLLFFQSFLLFLHWLGIERSEARLMSSWFVNMSCRWGCAADVCVWLKLSPLSVMIKYIIYIVEH